MQSALLGVSTVAEIGRRVHMCAGRDGRLAARDVGITIQVSPPAFISSCLR